MAKQIRNVRLNFYVTEQEKELLDERVVEAHAGIFSNFARKMLLEGEIRWVDVSALRDVNRVLGSINRDKGASEQISRMAGREKSDAERGQILRECWRISKNLAKLLRRFNRPDAVA